MGNSEIKQVTDTLLKAEYRFLSELQDCSSMKQVREKTDKRMREILEALDMAKPKQEYEVSKQYRNGTVLTLKNKQ